MGLSTSVPHAHRLSHSSPTMEFGESYSIRINGVISRRVRKHTQEADKGVLGDGIEGYVNLVMEEMLQLNVHKSIIIIVGGANMRGWSEKMIDDELQIVRNAGVVQLQREKTCVSQSNTKERRELMDSFVDGIRESAEKYMASSYANKVMQFFLGRSASDDIDLFKVFKV
ncbi:hypothetical protein IGI04_006254, partial [Brassica rapa subsp. trilocularis]